MEPILTGLQWVGRVKNRCKLNHGWDRANKTIVWKLRRSLAVIKIDASFWNPKGRTNNDFSSSGLTRDVQ